jgi:superfamily II DNA/RNA helicase
MIQKPSDIGYEDCNFILPALKMNYIEVDAMHLSPPVDQLFRIEARLLSERQKERRETTELRISEVCKIVDSDKENQWLLWCDTNAESDALKKAIAGSVEVKGSDSADHKERSLVGFSNGSIRILITKPSIAGFGMNFQSCNNVVFVGLSDSYESFYQAIRRCWRFGQKRSVNCYVVTSNTEGNVSKNIRAKEERAKQLTAGMVASMAKASGIEVKKDKKFTVEYKRQFEMEMPKWISK